MNYLCQNPIPLLGAILENEYAERTFNSYLRQRHAQEKLSLLSVTTKIQRLPVTTVSFINHSVPISLLWTQLLSETYFDT